MTMRTNDNDFFNLTMSIEILYELEQINICVKLWNKTTHKIEKKFFPAADFSSALKYYKRCERFFF